MGKRLRGLENRARPVDDPEDEIGVLIYDWNGGEKWLFPLTPASKRESLYRKINQAQIGDMPSFSTTMQLGLTGLQNVSAIGYGGLVIRGNAALDNCVATAFAAAIPIDGEVEIHSNGPCQ